MTSDNIEMQVCKWYIDHSETEIRLDRPALDGLAMPPVIVVEGFEERSIGLLRRFASNSVRLPSLLVGRYEGNHELNARFRAEFQELAERLAPNNWSVIDIRESGKWVAEAVRRLNANHVLLDMSALTAEGIFGALDELQSGSIRTWLGYSEAAEYRPTKSEWEQLKQSVGQGVGMDSAIAEKTDDMPWLYGGSHRVEMMARHEGFDAAGVNALVAFLPFKCARLAAVIGEQDYSARMFIAGRPRREVNEWRIDALRRINAAVVKDWPVKEMPTFGYLSTLRDLAESICGDDGLLQRFDVHLAPMGSKLQKVACWALSALVPSITVITAIPKVYYPEAFSTGVGESWIFPILDPGQAVEAALSQPGLGLAAT